MTRMPSVPSCRLQPQIDGIRYSASAWQLKNDIDSYNDRRYLNDPIQMDFNFNLDLEELAQENEAA
jgi:hypothetical protein